MGKQVKAVYFTDKDNEILNYIKSKSNFSQYIRELIIKDMKPQSDISNEIKTYIENYIDYKLKGLNLNECKNEEDKECLEFNMVSDLF